MEGIVSFLSFGLTSQYVAHAATARTSSSVRPRTLFRDVRSLTMSIPADAQTNDKSALFSNRYRSASRLGRKDFESQSWIVLAITPRHKPVDVMSSGFVADTVSLTMMDSSVVCKG